jgi:AcrR family transcriptional regulator
MRPVYNNRRGGREAAAKTTGNILVSAHLLSSRKTRSRGEASSHWHVADPRDTLQYMGRHKTISDDEVLHIARKVFREQGHTATTRAIAEAAGISEAVLYQRFASKDELFFAAMRPLGPDLEELLGPEDPPDDAHLYLRGMVLRIGKYFAEVIPLALRLMTHPSFDPVSLARAQPSGAAVLQKGLAKRLASLLRRNRIAAPSESVAARLLVSLAHDWALGGVLSPGSSPHRERELKDLVDVVWEGLAPRSG